jgi:guanine deaminase
VLGDFALRGRAIHAPGPDCLEALTDALIEVGPGGDILTTGPATDVTGRNRAAGYKAAGRLFEIGPSQVLLPGLVDLHIHAPQWPQRGTALDLPLEQWLQDYTFPLEARFADLGYATGIYDDMVAALLANGTTSAVYFATIHLPATKALAEICLRRGQRALVGRVAMDHPDQCPAFYRDESAASAESETRALIAYIQALPGNAGRLVQPIITPRFIPACTDDLLARLGAVARETGCHVQTHCSESDWEHHHVLTRCGVTDTAALRRYGLLTCRTVLAHGNFVDDHDLDTIRAAGAGIAHCPLSNAYFAGSVFPLRRILAQRVKVGLGTDVAGGANPSLLASAGFAIAASRMLESGVDAALPPQRRGSPGAKIGAVEAFWLATVGGAGVLDQPTGLFEPGRRFDAILIDADVPHSNLSFGAQDDAETVLERIIHAANRANIRQVWVDGRVVHACEAGR